MKGHGKMENIISLKNIIVEFEDGERILKNISLDIMLMYGKEASNRKQ